MLSRHVERLQAFMLAVPGVDVRSDARVGTGLYQGHDIRFAFLPRLEGVLEVLGVQGLAIPPTRFLVPFGFLTGRPPCLLCRSAVPRISGAQYRVVQCSETDQGFRLGARLTFEHDVVLDHYGRMREDTDRALVDRAAGGDREAFATLIERHYGLIYRVGVRVLGDNEAAADLAQDVCVGLAARLSSYRGDSRFTTWLYRVVVNAARDRMRRDGTQRRHEAAFAEVDAMTRAGQAANDAESLWLRQMLGGLADDLRTTVVLVLQEGLQHAEAAEVLGVSESTVSWRMHEARKRLQALVAAEDEIA